MMKVTLSRETLWGEISLNGKHKSVNFDKNRSLLEMLGAFFNLSGRPQPLLLAGLIVFFFLLALNTLLLAYYIYQPEVNTFFTRQFADPNLASSTQAILPPAAKTPTQMPSCNGASLQIGADTWQVESAWRASDGSINVPSDTPGIAYWVQGPQNNDIFALSPTQANINLFSSLQDRELALLTTQDCDSVAYRLSLPQPGEPGQEQLASLPAPSIIVYLPDSSLTAGTYTTGSLSEVTITSLGESDPAPADPQVSISLQDVSTPTDGIHIQVVVTLLNSGTTPITVSNGDFTLLPTSASPLELIQSYPSLPARISPDQMITLNLVFLRPATPNATLKILAQSFSLSGY
jgi:hypothetical protein